jgi:2-haloacid dehalogenase
MESISRTSHRLKASHALSVPNPLNDVEALAFNVFGTVADYYHTISRELLRRAPNHITQVQAEEFVLEWRRGYFREIFKVAGGSGGSFIIDEIHRNVSK